MMILTPTIEDKNPSISSPSLDAGGIIKNLIAGTHGKNGQINEIIVENKMLLKCWINAE